MIYYKNMYFGINAYENAKKLYRLIKKRKFDELEGAFLITLPYNQKDVLEIYDPFMAIIHKPEIVGVAIGREEALNLVCGIVDEVYEKTGKFNVGEYLRERE